MRSKNSRNYILIGKHLICGVRELAFVLDCDYDQAKELLHYQRLDGVTFNKGEYDQETLANAYRECAPGVVYDRQEMKYYTNPTIAGEKIGCSNATIHNDRTRFEINNVSTFADICEWRVDYLMAIRNEIIENGEAKKGV